MITDSVGFICLNCGSAVEEDFREKSPDQCYDCMMSQEAYDLRYDEVDNPYDVDYPIPPVITTNLFGYNIEESLVDEFYTWCEQKGLGANQEIFEIWIECSDMYADEEENYLFDKGLL